MLNKQLQKLLAVTTLLTLLMIPVPIYADNGKVVFKLEEIKELTLKNSRALKSLNTVVEKTMISKNMAEDTYNNTSAWSTWRNQLEQLRYLNELLAADPGNTTLQANKAALEGQISVTKSMLGTSTDKSIQTSYTESIDAYDDANTSLGEQEEKLLYQAETLYGSILTTTVQSDFAAKSYSIKESALRIEKLKSQLGMSTSLNTETAEIELASTAKTLDVVNNSLTLLKWQMNDMIGRDLKMPLVLEDLTVKEFQTVTYDSLVNAVMEKNSALAQKKRDLSQKENELNDVDIDKDSNKKGLVKNSISSQKIDIEQTKVNLQTAVKEVINNHAITMAAYEAEKLNYKNASETHRLNQVKYDLGLVSRLQLDMSEMSYLDALRKFNQAKVDYHLAGRAIELAQKGILLENTTK